MGLQCSLWPNLSFPPVRSFGNSDSGRVHKSSLSSETKHQANYQIHNWLLQIYGDCKICSSGKYASSMHWENSQQSHRHNFLRLHFNLTSRLEVLPLCKLFQIGQRSISLPKHLPLSRIRLHRVFQNVLISTKQKKSQGCLSIQIKMPQNCILSKSKL